MGPLFMGGEGRPGWGASHPNVSHLRRLNDDARGRAQLRIWYAPSEVRQSVESGTSSDPTRMMTLRQSGTSIDPTNNDKSLVAEDLLAWEHR